MAREGIGLEITELRLGLPGDNIQKVGEKPKEKKRAFFEISSEDENGILLDGDEQKVSPAIKSLVVGWPPVCCYRKKNSNKESKMYVKVSMDGAPFLRKIDLGMHQGYDDLAEGLETLFGCFHIGGAWKDAETGEFVSIYEDKDGDWMLAGDVPWRMFIESCKRLRIMKRSEATGFSQHSTGAISMDEQR